MATKGEWEEVREEIVKSGGLRSHDFHKLYALAMKDGMGLLRSKFRNQLSNEQCEDLIHGVLAKTSELLLSESTRNPKGMFSVSLRNAAFSYLRRPISKEVSLDALHEKRGDLPPAETENFSSQLEAKSELSAFLNFLTPTERHVISAMVYGESPQDIAMALGTSRDNVYQIIRRARKKRQVYQGESQ